MTLSDQIASVNQFCSSLMLTARFCEYHKGMGDIDPHCTACFPSPPRPQASEGSTGRPNLFQGSDFRLDHRSDEVLEAGLRLPAEDSFRLARVPAKVVDLRGTEVLVVHRHVFLPIRNARETERLCHELSYGM